MVKGFAPINVQLLATSEELVGKQTASTAPLPLICASVIRNTWLPIMTPLLSHEVEEGCKGHICVSPMCIHTSTESE